jgi:hypothetical protein
MSCSTVEGGGMYIAACLSHLAICEFFSTPWASTILKCLLTTINCGNKLIRRCKPIQQCRPIPRGKPVQSCNRPYNATVFRAPTVTSQALCEGLVNTAICVPGTGRKRGPPESVIRLSSTPVFVLLLKLHGEIMSSRRATRITVVG